MSTHLIQPNEPTDEQSTDTQEKQSLYGHIKSFVHRKGHFSEAQRRAYETQMPIFGVPYENKLKTIDEWHAIFGNTNPIVLEIGCGMGETTAKIALQNPNINYIGIEVFKTGVGALLKRIEENQLTNLRVMQHDAVEVVRDMMAHGVLDGVHVYFPDPWHKARHNKRRLIQSPFVRELALRLKTGGYIHCATDWEDYAIQMLDVLSRETLLTNTATDLSLGGYIPRPEGRPLTKYENRGNRLGHGVWDLVFIKNIV